MSKTVARVPSYLIGKEKDYDEHYIRLVKAGNKPRARDVGNGWDIADAQEAVRFIKRQQRKNDRLESKRELRKAIKEVA